MKAPDKIYINGFSAFATEPVKDGIEFIRKDALLEWAKDELNKLEALSDNDAVHWGQRNAFKQMIDKLNSM